MKQSATQPRSKTYQYWQNSATTGIDGEEVVRSHLIFIYLLVRSFSLSLSEERLRERSHATRPLSARTSEGNCLSRGERRVQISLRGVRANLTPPIRSATSL